MPALELRAGVTVDESAAPSAPITGKSGFKRRLRRGLQLVVMFAVALALLLTLPHALVQTALMPWKHLYRALHPNAPFTIYVIGGSTSVGEPYQSKISFPRIVSAMFNDRLAGRPIEIVNLARSGRDVEYGWWALMKELAARPGDGIVLVYAGINDPVTRGDDPTYDRWAFFHRLAVASRLQYLLDDRRAPEALRRFFAASDNTLRRYETRLQDVVELAHRYDLKVVMSTLVGNVTDYGPSDLAAVIAPDSPSAEPVTRAIALEKRGRHAEATRLYESIEASCEPRVGARVAFHRARCLERLGRHDEARDAYWKATDADGLIIPNPFRNQAVKDVATRTGSILVDAAAMFEAASPHGLIGYTLIIDGHHPNLEGYALLAQGFTRGMGEALGVVPARTTMSPTEIEARFGFDDGDRAHAWFSRSEWILNYLSLHDDFYGTRAAKVGEYLRLAEACDTTRLDASELAFVRFAVAVMARDAKKAGPAMDQWEASRRQLMQYQGNWLATHLDDLRVLDDARRARLRKDLEGFEPTR